MTHISTTEFIIEGSCQGGTQDSHLEAGTKSEALEECCLLASSSWLGQFAVLYCPGPPTGVALVLESSALPNQSLRRKCPLELLRGRFYGGKICSSQTCLDLFRTDRKVSRAVYELRIYLLVYGFLCMLFIKQVLKDSSSCAFVSHNLLMFFLCPIDKLQ